MATQNDRPKTRSSQRISTRTPQRSASIKQSTKRIDWNFPLDRTNFIYLLIGIGVILIGYILLATGISEEPALPDGKWNNPLAVYVAPTLLVIGYCVIIPYSILKIFNKKKEAQA